MKPHELCWCNFNNWPVEGAGTLHDKNSNYDTVHIGIFVIDFHKRRKQLFRKKKKKTNYICT